MQRPSAAQLRLFVGLGVAVLVLAYSATTSRRPPRAPRGKTEARRSRFTRAEKPAPLRAAAPSDAAFGRYEMIVSRNIFSPPKPPAPLKTASRDDLPSINPARRDSQPPSTAPPARPSGPPAPPPLTGWSYVGYVVIGGKQLGIVQNDSASTTENAEVGGQFHGYKVESVDSEQIVLTAEGSKQVLARPKEFQLVPLGGSVADAGQRVRQ